MPNPTPEDVLITEIEGCQIWKHGYTNIDYVKFISPTEEEQKKGAVSVDTILDIAFEESSMRADSGDQINYYARFFLPFRKALKDLSPALRPAKEFMEYIVGRFRNEHFSAHKMFEQGLIDVSQACYLIELNEPYVYYGAQHACWQIGVLKKIIRKDPMFGPPYMEFTFISSTYGCIQLKDEDKGYGESSYTVGLGFIELTCRVHLGIIKEDEFLIRKVKPADITAFEARTKSYLELVQNAAVADYKGRFMEVSRNNPVFAHTGRVIVDGMALHAIEPQLNEMAQPVAAPSMPSGAWKLKHQISAEACLYGQQLVFSLQNCKWGGVQIDKLTKTVFRKDGINSLVLSDHKKMLLKALVSHDRDVTLRDFVDQKASATIILLSGAPGGGKTLSAQVTAEFLSRPLYVIDMNSINLDKIQDELRKLLRLTRRWNAVVLIDEADALLRNRQKCVPEEARRVATFLRILEEYEGVVFLTSNHLTDIDYAILSRVSLVMKYGAIAKSLRKTIWTNLLKGVPNSGGAHTGRLSNWPLNGRQIKHATKMGMILSCDMQKPLTTDLMETVLRDAHGPLWKLRIGAAVKKLCGK